MDRAIEVRYARSGDARVAFTVRGRGAYQIVSIPNWLGNQDLEMDPHAIDEGLMSIGTVVSYDQRGSGLSDPVALNDLPTLERWTDDLHAVLDAAGVERAVLLATGPSGPIAILFAASHPERTQALILMNTLAAAAWSEDYPAGVKSEDFERWIGWIQRVWGTGQFIAALGSRPFVR